MASAPRLDLHHEPHGFCDHFARAFVRCLRFLADTFFARRYGPSAVVLETVSAVPGMVGATLQHLKALRRMRNDCGWVRTLMEEAEDQRMHLMTFVEIAHPNLFERLLVLLAQGLFYNAFFLLYLISPRTAHRVVGYFEEAVIASYTRYLTQIEDGKVANEPAPPVAIEHWQLPPQARLHDVVLAVREDEIRHRDLNHRFADDLARLSTVSSRST